MKKEIQKYILAILICSFLPISFTLGEDIYQQPLTSLDILEKIANRNIRGVDREGYPVDIYVDSNLTFHFRNWQISEPHSLLKNGILCSEAPQKRFCYRLFLDGDFFSMRYAVGVSAIEGRLE